MQLNRNQKILTAGVFIFFSAVLFQTAILSAIVNYQVKHKVALKQGWEMRALWSRVPFAFYFHFYFFNVTNPKEIDKGGKPILQEVGPFVYDEWHEKTNQMDREEDDTISYTKRNTFYFNAEKSNGLTGEEELIVPSYFILGLVHVILKTRPAAIGFIGKAVDSIFKKPESLFMKAKVNDILFNGLIIDCNVNDTISEIVCNEINSRYDELGLKKLEEKKFSMALWASFNATDAKKRTRVHRGLHDIMDVGKVVEYNNKKNISVWGDKYCDTFNGTDGTIFHPFFDKHGRDDVVAYNEDLCRSISCAYDSDSEFAGFNTLRYTADLGVDVEKNPRQKCYCETPDSCLKKGAFDIYKCIGAPLIVTNPHFYLADPYYHNLVDGLRPEKEKHAILIDLEPFSGAPLHAHTRAQFNMFLANVPKFDLMKNFNDALLPLVWVDQEVILPDYLLKELKISLILMKISKIFNYLLMIGGLGMCAYAGYKIHKAQENKLNINPKVKSVKSISSKIPMHTSTQNSSIPTVID